MRDRLAVRDDKDKGCTQPRERGASPLGVATLAKGFIGLDGHYAEFTNGPLAGARQTIDGQLPAVLGRSRQPPRRRRRPGADGWPP
jgi:hypothetical protein